MMQLEHKGVKILLEQIPASELLACHMNGAVRTVSEEDRSLYWSYDESRTLAVVYQDLMSVSTPKMFRKKLT